MTDAKITAFRALKDKGEFGKKSATVIENCAKNHKGHNYYYYIHLTALFQDNLGKRPP